MFAGCSWWDGAGTTRTIWSQRSGRRCTTSPYQSWVMKRRSSVSSKRSDPSRQRPAESPALFSVIQSSGRTIGHRKLNQQKCHVYCSPSKRSTPVGSFTARIWVTDLCSLYFSVNLSTWWWNMETRFWPKTSWHRWFEKKNKKTKLFWSEV